MTAITIMREEILADIADAAFLTADVAETGTDPHTLHQTYDICEGENLHRINHLLDLAFTEALLILRPLLDPLHPPLITPTHLTLSLKPPTFNLASNVLRLMPNALRLKLREYLTATVLATWLELTLPTAAPIWRQQSHRLARSLLPTIHLTRPLSPW